MDIVVSQEEFDGIRGKSKKELRKFAISKGILVSKNLTQIDLYNKIHYFVK